MSKHFLSHKYGSFEAAARKVGASIGSWMLPKFVSWRDSWPRNNIFHAIILDCCHVLWQIMVSIVCLENCWMDVASCC
jgi:hypothetical protein